VFLGAVAPIKLKGNPVRNGPLISKAFHNKTGIQPQTENCADYACPENAVQEREQERGERRFAVLRPGRFLWPCLDSHHSGSEYCTCGGKFIDAAPIRFVL
jgi:hypothetical protein